LLQQLGFRCATCLSVAQGLLAADNLAPAALIVDLALPEPGALHLIGELRQRPEHATRAVLVLQS
jgi:DNA-binding response OmpR family regulator